MELKDKKDKLKNRLYMRKLEKEVVSKEQAVSFDELNAGK